MEAELQDAPHLNHAEIANPQFFAPVVEYFEHQLYLVQIIAKAENAAGPGLHSNVTLASCVSPWVCRTNCRSTRVVVQKFSGNLLQIGRAEWRHRHQRRSDN